MLMLRAWSFSVGMVISASPDLGVRCLARLAPKIKPWAHFRVSLIGEKVSADEGTWRIRESAKLGEWIVVD